MVDIHSLVVQRQEGHTIRPIPSFFCSGHKFSYADIHILSP